MVIFLGKSMATGLTSPHRLSNYLSNNDLDYIDYLFRLPFLLCCMTLRYLYARCLIKTLLLLLLLYFFCVWICFKNPRNTTLFQTDWWAFFFWHVSVDTDEAFAISAVNQLLFCRERAQRYTVYGRLSVCLSQILTQTTCRRLLKSSLFLPSRGPKLDLQRT